MVRRAVSARVEDYVRGDAKFLGGGDASGHSADHGGDGLPLPQYPYIQSEATGRSLSERGPTGRVIREVSRQIESNSRVRSIDGARLFPSFAIEKFLNTNASRHVQYQ